MASDEEENVGLREEIGNLKEGMEKMAAMMEAMMTAQAEARAQVQAQPIPTVNVASASTPRVIPTATTGTSQPIPTATATSAGIPQSIPFTPAVTAGITQPLTTEFSLNDMTNMYNAGFRPPGFSSTPQHGMPPGYPWGMPTPVNECVYSGNAENLFPHGQQATPFYQPAQTAPQATVTYAKPLIHTIPPEEGPIYHSDSVVGDDGMGNLEEKFDAVQKELKTIRGKDMFGQSLNDLCLVPNVVMPYKFKTPNFEKYKGDTCPQNHLIMYARKMQAYKDNEPLLIHCFQDSLTGPTSIWFLNLKKVATFEELASAFF